MSFWQGRSKRKASGGKYSSVKKKKSRVIGRDPLYARLGNKLKKVVLRTRGGNHINSLREIDFANVSDGKKTKKVKIKRLVENPASRHFVRQNIITRGAIIDTDAGMAKVTSRPTRDGTVNAILLKTK